MRQNKLILLPRLLSGLVAFGFGLLGTGPVSLPVQAQSAYTTRLADPRAVYLDAEEFGAKGDGIADDSFALQAALDKAESATAHEGILFVPAGRYRITRTIYISARCARDRLGRTKAGDCARRSDAGIPEGHWRDGDDYGMDSA